MITSFDLFGTLVDVDRAGDPAEAVASELAARDIPVPSDWASRYRERHVEVPPGVERPLHEHVRAALDVDVASAVVETGVLDAFTPETVETRPGASRAVDAATAHGPVAVLSNCSVPGLVERVLDRSALPDTAFDAVIASVDCGYRKPDERAFRAVTNQFDAGLGDLVHVGDDPATDGGATDAGAHCILLTETSLADVPSRLEAVR